MFSGCMSLISFACKLDHGETGLVEILLFHIVVAEVHMPATKVSTVSFIFCPLMYLATT